MEAPAGVAGLATLTPGDFSVVRRKAEVLGCLDEPRALVEMLYEESRSKREPARKIGFNLQVGNCRQSDSICGFSSQARRERGNRPRQRK